MKTTLACSLCGKPSVAELSNGVAFCQDCADRFAEFWQPSNRLHPTALRSFLRRLFAKVGGR